jgi:hypothetical protein
VQRYVLCCYGKATAMDEPANSFDLSADQRTTAKLLDRLLGQVVAARYEDLCRLSAGAFRLNVSKPMAAHALRELDSMVRSVLTVPVEAPTAKDPIAMQKSEAMRALLESQGYDPGPIKRAMTAVEPRTTHKDEIRVIAGNLGFDPNSDLVRRWSSIVDNYGRAHERSFHASLEVDDDFRENFLQPYDSVIRELALAVEGQYATLMRRVGELARSPKPEHAVKQFKKNIAGALILQWHFFQSLTSGNWIPLLIREGLIREPLIPLPDSSGDTISYRQWPAGNYLLRMAESPEPTTRKSVADALRLVANSTHPDVRQDGIGILAALPPEESAPLADLAIAWLQPDLGFAPVIWPEQFVKKLADANQCEAALNVARALFCVVNNDGKIATLFSQHMYEHHLPILVPALTSCCGVEALTLFIDLLVQTVVIIGNDRYRFYSSQHIGTNERHHHDVFETLIGAVCDSAKIVVSDNPSCMSDVIGMLTEHSLPIFTRLALHVLSQNPNAASDKATAFLRDVTLIGQSTYQHEYADLAVAWFPSMPTADQEEIFRFIDVISDNYLDRWKARFEEVNKKSPTTEDERIYRAQAVRDAAWEWRSVLPNGIRAAVEATGDPGAWRRPMSVMDESPLNAEEFSDKPISEIIDYLAKWRPEEEPRRQTVTALAYELRNAAADRPKDYAASADKFSSLKPIYVRRLMEGLGIAVSSNQKSFEWTKVLRLIESIYTKNEDEGNTTTNFEGDDPSWFEVHMEAGRLLAAGLRYDSSGMSIEHSAAVRTLVLEAVLLIPTKLEVDDFEEKFERQSFFPAQETARGLTVELCILLIHWLNLHGAPSTEAIRRPAITADPEIAQVFEDQLADRTPDGRVPRSIMGRYLRLLFYNDKDWLQSHMAAIFPKDDYSLRSAAWRSHLLHDGGPISDLTPELLPSYIEEIGRLNSNANAAGGSDRNFLQERFASYVMCLVLYGDVPEVLLQAFLLRASSEQRRQAMWFVGNEVSRPASEFPDDARARGLAYWERRLAAAAAADQPDSFSEELGAISNWCFHNVVDQTWLCEQLIQMLGIGLMPSDGHGVIEWLGKVGKIDIDRAMEVFANLVRSPKIERWAFMGSQASIRFLLGEGVRLGTPATIERVRTTISYLAAQGDPSYLDLEPPVAA